MHGPAEGPVWIEEKGYLLFSDIHAWSKLYFAGWASLNRIRLDIPGVPMPRGSLP